MKTLWVQATPLHPQARPPAKTAFPNLGEFWRTARRWAQMDLWPRRERAGAGQGGVGEGIGFWAWMGWAAGRCQRVSRGVLVSLVKFPDGHTFSLACSSLRGFGPAVWPCMRGLGVGLCVYGPQLAFFWKIFGPSAVALWLILACWLGLFLVLLRAGAFAVGRTRRGIARAVPLAGFGIRAR